MGSDSEAESNDLIVIGIDFETTFSGVAWAYSGEPNDIEIVTNWDSEMNHCDDAEKTPTRLYYGGSTETTTWGYSIPADKQALKWFKLLLLDEKDVPKAISASTQLAEARRLQKRVNRDPVDIIACFLRNIWNHSVDSIQRTLGSALLQRCKFHVVITLPAIWPEYAQQRMKRAAKLSGILDKRSCGKTTLRFISEPEAAALATIKEFSRRSTIKVIPSSFVMRAVGQYYIIEKVEPFTVKECVKGHGDLCGGIFLDEHFLRMIKEKVTAESWGSVSPEGEKKFLNDEWEHGIKPQFQNKPRTWLVELPENCSVPSKGKKPGAGLKRRMTLELTTGDILPVFSPIVDRIKGLIDQQVNEIKKKYECPPKYIVLVGGFGRSRYLFEYLQATSDQSSTTILQARGTKPWTTICRGAVIQGLTKHSLMDNLGVQIGSRIARMNYGIRYEAEFSPWLHREEDKVWSESEQRFDARNQMQWFLKQGDDINDKKPVRQSYYILYSEPIEKIANTIYQSPAVLPPTRKDSTTKQLCTTKWNQEIVLESLPTYTNTLGKVYHQLEYDIEMTFEDGTVDFTVYFEGKRVAGHNVDVEFH